MDPAACFRSSRSASSASRLVLCRRWKSGLMRVEARVSYFVDVEQCSLKDYVVSEIKYNYALVDHIVEYDEILSMYSVCWIPMKLPILYQTGHQV